MINEKRYNLVIEVLNSDLPKETRNEIVRFYTLPRNTPVKPMIELPDEPGEDVGPIKRPTPHDLERKKDPEMAAEEDATTETLKGQLDGT